MVVTTTMFVQIILAAEATPDVNWTSAFSVITQVAFSVVVAWYLLSRAIPKMQEQFSSDLKIQRDDFQKEREREREYYRLEREQERESIKQLVQVINDARFDEIHETGELVKQLISEQARVREVVARIESKVEGK